jgi:hypothetical protein
MSTDSKCGEKFIKLVAEGFWQWVCMREACCWEPSNTLKRVKVEAPYAELPFSYTGLSLPTVLLIQPTVSNFRFTPLQSKA